METKRIYVASSWRNARQPEIVAQLRAAGFEVYDFKDSEGFRWSDIDPDWKNWTNEQYLKALDHPLAVAGYSSDYEAMQWADTHVLVQPCGRSAHLELGFAVGQGKRTAILLSDEIEPELMVKMADLMTANLGELMEWLRVRKAA